MKTREKGSVDWQTPEGTKHDELVITDGNLPETLLSRTPSLSYPCLFTLQGLQQAPMLPRAPSPCKLRLDNYSQKQAKGEKKPPARGGEIEKTPKETGFPKRKELGMEFV